MSKKEKLKEVYHSLREEFKGKGFITGTKSQVFDFVVLGFSSDTYVKIVKPKELDNVEKMISYMRGFASKRRYLNVRYILVYLDREFNVKARREIELT